MTGEELVDELVALCYAVFVGGVDASERTQRLEAEIKHMIGRFSRDLGDEERKMISHESPCHVYVVSGFLKPNLMAP